MSNSFPELGFFIVDLVISFLVLVFTLRILLAMTSASSNNPLTQSIIKISKPIRSLLLFIPNLGKFEISSFAIIFICHFLNIYFQSTILGSDIILEKLVLFSFKSLAVPPVDKISMSKELKDFASSKILDLSETLIRAFLIFII